MSKLAVLSLSGGMDSTSLLVKLIADGYTVFPVLIDYGQKHKVELVKAQQNIYYLERELNIKIDFQLLPMGFLGKMFESSLTNKDIKIPEGHYEEDNMKSTVVPNRNAIFSSIIYGYALSIAKKEKSHVYISLGVHSGDHAIYPDCTPMFRDKLELAFKEGNWDSNLASYLTPYIEMNKTTILEDCLKNCKKLKIKFDTVLGNTITSYNPDVDGRSSGKSGSDIERIEAFINIGRKDPIEYQEPWKDVVKHAKKVLNAKK